MAIRLFNILLCAIASTAVTGASISTFAAFWCGVGFLVALIALNELLYKFLEN